MPFYLEMSKNATQQRDIYDIVIFRFLQIYVCIIEIIIIVIIRIYIQNISTDGINSCNDV